MGQNLATTIFSREFKFIIDARRGWNLNLHKNHYYQAFVIIQEFIVNVWPWKNALSSNSQG